MNEQTPLPPGVAWRAVARCVTTTAVLLARRRVHLPRRHVGMRVRFADGSRSVVYRGLYEWDGPAHAESYARSLWRVLALVSVRGSIHYRVLPGLRRDVLLARPDLLQGEAVAADSPNWWRPVAVA